MRFLTKEDTDYLSPWVWRSWKRSRYSGGIWWKLEDVIDISDLHRGVLDTIDINRDEVNRTEYVPFTRFSFMQKGISHRGLSRGQSMMKLRRNVVSCVATACSESSNRFVALDSADSLYLVDLDHGIIWKLMQCSMVETISFCHGSLTDILLGKKSGNIEKISLEPLGKVGQFTQHCSPVKEMLFLNEEYCLSYSDQEAWIWNLFTFEPVHSLTFKKAASVMKVVPSGGVLTVLSDNVFHVWRQPCKADVPRLVASYVGEQFMVEREVTCVEFAIDRQVLAIGGRSKLISIVNVTEDYWTLEKVIKLPQTANAVKELKFMNLSVLGEKNDSSEDKLCWCLAVFTLPSYELVIYNLEEEYVDADGSPICKLIDVEYEPRGFQLTGGGYAVFRLQDGFMDVYSTFWWLTEKICSWLHYDRKLSTAVVSVRPNIPLVAQPLSLAPGSVFTQRTMYREVLHQLGELPAGERCDYWTLGLVLPANVDAFKNLAHRYLHPVCQRLTLPSCLTKETSFLLTRLYSAFCYLSPLFYVLEDFPLVLINFCKVSSWNLMSAFEIVLTILANYCSDWYANYPNPPEHIMNLLDKLVDLKDKSLAEHMRTFNVTPSQVGWALLSNLFVKSVDLKKWSILWDHIIFCERDYLVMVAASIILNSRCTFSGVSKKTDLNALQKRMYSSNINIGSVILVAHDLLDLQKKCQKIEYCESFAPLNKNEYYENEIMRFDEKTIKDAVHKKLEKLHVEDICVQENIDAFKLLDPRKPYNDIIENILKQKNAITSSESMGNIDSKKILSEEDVDINKLLFDLSFIENDRKAEFLHLKKILNGHALRWIPNWKFREGEKNRLELFRSYWPSEETVNVGCSKREVKIKNVDSNDENIRFTLASELSKVDKSLSYLFSESENTKIVPGPEAQPELQRSKISKTSVQKDKTLRPEVPTRNTHPSLKYKKKLYSIFTRYAECWSTRTEKNADSFWEDEWSWLKYSMEELEGELELMGMKLKSIRQELRQESFEENAAQWGEEKPWEFPESADPPVQSPGADWRKDKKEEFLALIDVLYEKINMKTKGSY